MKYRWILLALKDDELYTPSAIADLAMAMGAQKKHPKVPEKLLRLRIRVAMGRYGSNHGFPRRGDGLLRRSKQAYTPAWFGKRWKGEISEKGSTPDGEYPKDGEPDWEDLASEQQAERFQQWLESLRRENLY